MSPLQARNPRGSPVAGTKGAPGCKGAALRNAMCAGQLTPEERGVPLPYDPLGMCSTTWGSCVSQSNRQLGSLARRPTPRGKGGDPWREACQAKGGKEKCGGKKLFFLFFSFHPVVQPFLFEKRREKKKKKDQKAGTHPNPHPKK